MNNEWQEWKQTEETQSHPTWKLKIRRSKRVRFIQWLIKVLGVTENFTLNNFTSEVYIYSPEEPQSLVVPLE